MKAGHLNPPIGFLFAVLVTACQGATAPDLPLLRDARGSYQVSWLVTYRAVDTALVAQSACPGSVVIEQVEAGQLSGTAIMSPEVWPCVAAVVPIRGTLQAIDPDPFGGGGWRLATVLAPTAVFEGCTFLEPAPDKAAWAPYRGLGTVSPVGEIDLVWFRDVYDCHGTRLRLEASLAGNHISG
jgi:hypothetical protein